jgi:hypothetical protein
MADTSAKRALVLLQLGATYDAKGRLDASAHIRGARTLNLYWEAVAAGRHCRVLTSGAIAALHWFQQPLVMAPQEVPPTGTEPEACEQQVPVSAADALTAGATNATALRSSPENDSGPDVCSTALWQLTADMLVARGLPEEALVTPGLLAYTTVEEALLARHALLQGALDTTAELVLVTSDYHAARAEHLFRIAFGQGAGLHLPLRVDAVPSVLPQAELDSLFCGFEVAPEISLGGFPFFDLEARLAHEAKALRGLREAPFGPWLDFLQSHGLANGNADRCGRQGALTDE